MTCRGCNTDTEYFYCDDCLLKEGDRVEVVEAPVFIGGKGSDEWIDLEPNQPGDLTRYDMSHLVGLTGTIKGYIPVLLFSGETRREEGAGWYQIDFDDKEKARYPMGLFGFNTEELKRI